MNSKKPLHLIYLPRDLSTGTRERFISLLETNDIEEVLRTVRAAPGAIALELCSHDREAILEELHELGFTT